MSPQSWADEQASRIASEVRRLRGSNSAQWLSDRTAALGHTVTRSVIADLENGRRKYVTTAELIVLAAALNTAPIALLFPAPLDEEVWALPRVGMARFLAAEEFCGNPDSGLASPENIRALQRARDGAAARATQRALLGLLAQLEQKPERLGYDDPERAAKEIRAELDKTARRIEGLEADDGG